MKEIDNFINRNYTQGRQGLDMLLFFVVHTYNGKGTSLKNWFQNNNLGVSSTDAVWKDGTVEHLVRDEDTAHHAGNWWVNVRSIGIEHQDDGNPNDSARTDELYEATCQNIAKKAFRIGHKVLNESNIKPHSDFTSTGCPAALDINRIRRRSNEILQSMLAPQVPEWKKNAIDIGLRNYKVQKDVNLYDISDGRVIKSFPKGTDIGVRYEYNGFLITEYSYNNEFDSGFKKSDLEFTLPPTWYVNEVSDDKTTLLLATEIEAEALDFFEDITDVGTFELKKNEELIKFKTNEPPVEFTIVHTRGEDKQSEIHLDAHKAYERFEDLKAMLIAGDILELFEGSNLINSYKKPMENPVPTPAQPVLTVETLSERLQNSFSYAVPVQLLTGALGVIIAYNNPAMPTEVVFAYTTIAGIFINVGYAIARFIGSKMVLVKDAETKLPVK